MAENVHMPKLSEVMSEGHLLEWKVGEGQWIEAGQALMIVETEKVTVDVEAPSSGFLHIMAKPDTVWPVGALLGRLAGSREELEGLKQEQAVALPQSQAPQLPPSANEKRRGRIFISPVARKLAEEHRVDITRVAGTGPEGRITRNDILKAADAGKAVPAASQRSDGKKINRTIPLTGARKVMSERMQQSLQNSAQVTNGGTVDASYLIQCRKSLLLKEKDFGFRISYTDILVKWAALALRQHPILNASLVGNEIVVWEDINIGVALDVVMADGTSLLIVPVVKNADRKSLVEIHQTLADLTERGRHHKLQPEDCDAPTFTLSNTGIYKVSSGFGTPILNPPEVALLVTRAIEDRPVARDNQVVIRPVMEYAVTYDHRVVTGGDVMRFRETLERLAANPVLLFV
jgi:pyruvate dehydrogenase E2 component (dihydrolipoamide acetyltransferase)